MLCETKVMVSEERFWEGEIGTKRGLVLKGKNLKHCLDFSNKAYKEITKTEPLIYPKAAGRSIYKSLQKELLRQ